MSSKGKGKEVVGKGSSGKRKRDDDKSGTRKRINREVLQFFEDAAGDASDYDTSDFEDDFQEDGGFEPEERSEPGKSQQLPFFPKEEELSGDELERVLEERYRSGSGYVRYAEDDYETKRVNRDFVVPSAPDPNIWKVKCKVGRERQTIFCLMQKFVDLKSIGTKLQISSAFSIDHVKGFVFVEAYKQFEVMEACRQLPDVYYSMISSVPNSELSQLLAVRRKQPEVTKGMWVRVKNGNYKGDLAQVVAVNESRRKATVKLIPRVDFQALAAKFGSGSSIKRAPPSKPRLIASSELEEFRPLIQYRRDRDTGINFEVLDGLMLKDGFLYKKVSIDSLRLCDVNPSVEEVQKFRTPDVDNSSNLEFLSQLYGEKKEKSTPVQAQTGGKGEGTSGSKEQENVEVHDLVLFGKREFGMVIGLEKDDTYKILKYGPEGSVVVSLGKKDVKNLHLDKKFTALDNRSKNIFVSDAIRVLDGPLKDREGVIKQIYRGIIFIYDQNDMEDNAYFCAKSQCCEKVKQNDDICIGKNGEAGPSGCEVLPSSPKSPLSPEKPWQMGEQNREFNRREKEGMFSVGQSLRIRVGPLKGYLCRVMAVRRSDVTVKLDSRQKVLTVKSEHLSEVRGKNFATSTCDDAGLDSSRPFDFLGNQDGGNDWMGGSAQTADGNDLGPSNERSSWPAFPSSAPSIPWGADSQNVSGSSADAAWQKKPSTTFEGGSGWGVPKVDSSSVLGNDASASWGGSIGSLDNQDGDNNPEDPWNKGKKVVGSTSGWGNVSAEKVQQDPVNKENDGWGQQSSWEKSKGTAEGNLSWGSSKALHENVIQDSENAWDKAKSSQDKGTGNSQDSWGKAVETWGNKSASGGTKDQKDPVTCKDSLSGDWGSQPQGQSATGGWGKGSNDGEATKGGGQTENDGWGKPKPLSAGSSWSKPDLSTGEPSWSKSAGNSAWGQSSGSEDDQGFSGGRGFGGRRGRGNFNGRHDQSGRGRGRSFGRGQFSSWNKDGQDGTSWGNTSDQGSNLGKDDWKSKGGSEDKGWQKPKTYEAESKGWNAGNATSDQDNSSGWKCGTSGSAESNKNTWGASTERSSDPATGWNSSSSGWGQQKSWEKDKGDADGNSAWGKATEESQVKDVGAWGNSGGNWSKTTDGNSAWGKATEESQVKGVGAWGNSGGSWARANDSGGSKEWKTSSDAPENKSGSWGDSGGSFGNNRGRGRGRGDYGGRGDFGGRRGRGGYRGGRDQSSRGRGRSFGGRQNWNNEGEDKPSWGSSFGGNSDDGGGSWGKDKGGSWGNSSAGGNDQSNSWFNKDKGGNDGNGGSWGNSSGGSWGKEKGGGGWGTSAGGSDQSSGWGKGSAGNDSWGKQKGGGGWGNDSAGGTDQSSGWGKGSAGNDGDSTWGKNEGGSMSSGGWGNSSSGNNKSASGWGSSSGGKSDETEAGGGQGSGGWGNPSAGSKNSAGGWGSSPSGKSDKAGAGAPATGGWGSSSGGNNSSAGGWGSSSGGKNDKGGSGGGVGSTAGWGNSPGGNGNSSAGGWGSQTGGKSEEAGVGGAAGSTAGWGSSSGGSGNSSAGGWGSQSGGKSDEAGVGGAAGSTAGWGSQPGGKSDDAGVSGGAGSTAGWGSTSGGNGNSSAGGWGSQSGGKSSEVSAGGGAGSTAGGWGNSSGGNNSSAGGWGSSSGGKNDEGGFGGGAGSSTAGWGKNSSGGNGNTSAGGWGS